MAELGIGTRVWIGWVPDDQIQTEFDKRCRTGTIRNGPFEPGVYANRDDEVVVIGARSWNVDTDDGGACFATEDILYPLDDGDDAVQDHDADEREDEGAEA